MALYFPDTIESTSPQEYGIVKADQVVGNKTVPTLADLYKIPDAILSATNNKDNDAIGLEWYVSSENKYYALTNWELRKTTQGWTEKVRLYRVSEVSELDSIKANHGDIALVSKEEQITKYKFTDLIISEEEYNNADFTRPEYVLTHGTVIPSILLINAEIVKPEQVVRVFDSLMLVIICDSNFEIGYFLFFKYAEVKDGSFEVVDLMALDFFTGNPTPIFNYQKGSTIDPSTLEVFNSSLKDHTFNAYAILCDDSMNYLPLENSDKLDKAFLKFVSAEQILESIFSIYKYLDQQWILDKPSIIKSVNSEELNLTNSENGDLGIVAPVTNKTYQDFKDIVLGEELYNKFRKNVNNTEYLKNNGLNIIPLLLYSSMDTYTDTEPAAEVYINSYLSKKDIILSFYFKIELYNNNLVITEVGWKDCYDRGFELIYPEDVLSSTNNLIKSINDKYSNDTCNLYPFIQYDHFHYYPDDNTLPEISKLLSKYIVFIDPESFYSVNLNTNGIWSNILKLDNNNNLWLKGVGGFTGKNSVPDNSILKILGNTIGRKDLTAYSDSWSDPYTVCGEVFNFTKDIYINDDYSLLANLALGVASHAEGYETVAGDEASHAEGSSTEARGRASHAEGINTEANGEGSHAEGNNTEANGYSAHAEGFFTIADNQSQHSQGQFNTKEPTPSLNNFDSTKMLFNVGNGESNEARSDALRLLGNGNLYLPNIGGFTGKELNGSAIKSLLEVILELTKRIEKLEANNI